jgi:hypothetical protein
MKKAAIFFIFILIGCKQKNEIYQSNGLDGKPEYMYFKNEQEGYIFGTLEHWEEMSEKQLRDPYFTPETTDEANIYKTIDGGHNWVKIDSILNYNYSTISIQFSKTIFISRRNSLVHFGNNIVKFDMLSDKITGISKDIKTISSLWGDSLEVKYTSNRGKISLYYLDENLKLKDSVFIKNYIIKSLFINEKNYAISSKEGVYYFRSIDKDKQDTNINIPIKPREITQQEKDKILIAGDMKNDSTSTGVVSYDTKTGKEKLLKEFKGYSIIEGLQSNDSVIVGFIGNISGIFVKYDLTYSLDKGETWKIQELEEPNYIRPSCLVDNIMYIYSGGARMQKIIFK